MCCAVNKGAKSDRSQIFHSFYFLSFPVLIGRKGSSAHMSLLLSKITEQSFNAGFCSLGRVLPARSPFHRSKQMHGGSRSRFNVDGWQGLDHRQQPRNNDIKIMLREIRRGFQGVDFARPWMNHENGSRKPQVIVAPLHMVLCVRRC